MSACITLEDGSYFWASNLGIAGLLDFAAELIEPEDARLAAWLRGLNDRGPGLQDFDLGALTPAHRRAFWEAVGALEAGWRDHDQDAAFSTAVAVTSSLAARRPSEHVTIDRPVEPVDLYD